MAATSTVRGRFAARKVKTWDAFTDERSGETVDSGKSLTLYVVTDDDDALEEIKVKRDFISKAESETGSLTFGDRVDMAVVVTRYGMNYVSLRTPAQAKG